MDSPRSMKNVLCKVGKLLIGGMCLSTTIILLCFWYTTTHGEKMLDQSTAVANAQSNASSAKRNESSHSDPIGWSTLQSKKKEIVDTAKESDERFQKESPSVPYLDRYYRRYVQALPRDHGNYILRWGIIRLANEQLYEGQIANRKPHGFGRMVYPDGSIYWGQWLDGSRSGEGFLVKAKDSSRTTTGADEYLYSGGWARDMKSGYGEIVYNIGTTYVGQWSQDSYHGEGKLTWPNRDSFTGRFTYGTRDGIGVAMFNDGSRFEGVWRNGQLTGLGRYWDEGMCLEITWLSGDPIVSSNC